MILGLQADNNFLINSEGLFAQRIQRAVINAGLALTPGEYYYTDRWLTGLNVVNATYQTNTASVPGNAEGYYRQGLTATTSATGQLYLYQKLEGALASYLQGRYLTLSMWVKSNTAQARLGFYDGTTDLVSTDPHSGGGNWEFKTFSFISTGKSVLNVYAIIGGESGGGLTTTPITSGDYIQIYLPKLEIGPKATPFIPRHPEASLALCQRYFEKTYNLDVAPGSSSGTGTHRFAASNTFDPVVLDFRFKVPKRVSPSVTVYASQTGTTGTFYSITVPGNVGVANVFSSGNSCILLNNLSGNFVAGHIYEVHMTFDAEL